MLHRIAVLFKMNSRISMKTTIYFYSLRRDWCSFANIEVMYEEMYEALVESSVAIKIDREVHVGVDGKIVGSTGPALSERLGSCQVNQIIIYMLMKWGIMHRNNILASRWLVC
jgi:hypothetical protein